MGYDPEDGDSVKNEESGRQRIEDKNFNTIRKGKTLCIRIVTSDSIAAIELTNILN